MSKIRRNKWDKDRRCFWCFQETEWNEEVYARCRCSKRLATLDHITSKLSLLRKFNDKYDGKKTVLCCSECNTKRAKLEQAYIEFIFKYYGVSVHAPHSLKKADRKRLFKKHHIHIPIINPHLNISIYLN